LAGRLGLWAAFWGRRLGVWSSERQCVPNCHWQANGRKPERKENASRSQIDFVSRPGFELDGCMFPADKGRPGAALRPPQSSSRSGVLGAPARRQRSPWGRREASRELQERVGQLSAARQTAAQRRNRNNNNNINCIRMGAYSASVGALSLSLSLGWRLEIGPAEWRVASVRAAHRDPRRPHRETGGRQVVAKVSRSLIDKRPLVAWSQAERETRPRPSASSPCLSSSSL